MYEQILLFIITIYYLYKPYFINRTGKQSIKYFKYNETKSGYGENEHSHYISMLYKNFLTIA